VVRRIFLNSALALAAVIFTLALVEGGSYFFRIPPPLHPSLFEFSPPPDRVKPLSSYLPARSLASVEADLAKARRYKPEARKKLVELASRFGLDYSDKGKFASPRSVVRIRDEGQIIYDVTINVDDYRRRNPRDVYRKKGPPLLLLGDSFVFGEGLEDQETFSQVLQRLQPSRPVYNLGVPGSGPNDLLRTLETGSEKFFAGLPVKDSTVVFLYNSAQNSRANCNMSNYAYPHLHLNLKKPFYSLNSEGNLEYQGTCESQRFRDFLFRMLSHSHFLVSNFIDLPPRQAKYPRQLVAKILTEIQKLVVERLGAKRMVVAVYPYPRGEIEHELQVLRETNLSLLDFSSLDIEGATKGDADIPSDFHPSPSAAVILAHLLNYNLPPSL
jgi:hypothetical protein